MRAEVQRRARQWQSRGAAVSEPEARLWLRTTPITRSPATTAAPDMPPTGSAPSRSVSQRDLGGARNPVADQGQPSGAEPGGARLESVRRQQPPDHLCRAPMIPVFPPPRESDRHAPCHLADPAPVHPRASQPYKPANGSLRRSTARSIRASPTAVLLHLPRAMLHSTRCPLPSATWSAVNTQRSSMSSPEPTHRVPPGAVADQHHSARLHQRPRVRYSGSCSA